MPLHTIPLCSFKYARDILSSATFKYDTTGKIVKNKEKLFYKEKNIEIEKIDINKKVYKDYKCIEKEKENNMKIKDKNINKNKDISLQNTNFISFIKNNNLNLKNDKDININIEKNIELQNKNDIDINIEVDKNLKEIKYISLNKNNRFINMTSREDLQLDKDESIYTDKIVEKSFIKHQFIQNLNLEKNINIVKHNYISFDRVYFKQFDVDKMRFIEKYADKYIDKNKYDFVDRMNINKADIIFNKTMLKRSKITKILKTNNLYHVNKITIEKICNDYKTKLLYKTFFKDIQKYKYIDAFNKISIKDIEKHYNKVYFYIEKLKAITKYNNKFFDKNNITFINKYNERYLNRDNIILINKNNEKYLNYMPLIDIYKQIEKDLLNISIIDLYKEHDSQLQGTLIKDIYKVGNNNKFIKIIKKWWWLNPTDPTDKLIIPNKDFDYKQDLLNNLDYEYLRFNNHPIPFGVNWGIDYNIPPYAVSIEIMLDLINILMMIWHKNTQGWLCCSGKEAIQFIIEVLYDWYTLDTSTPNTDYIKAYRWIRWEVEKVYFLNTENGLQAIGILIANLIDYMKYHHFDLVPLWRNPKAMDIERQFNRVATNGDIIKDLDKLKGKRHYYIETQNFEKKNIRR